jgi:nucleoside-diphosphate-sugar epimerase
VIPTIITQITNGQNKINLGSTTPTRDFNFIKDTVAAFLAALNSDKGLGEVVNFGSNYEISVGDTAHLIAEVMKAKIEIITEETRLRPVNSEVERLCADNAKAKALFNWQPTYGGREGFKRGLIETAAWFQDSANMAHYKTDRYNL